MDHKAEAARRNFTLVDENESAPSETATTTPNTEHGVNLLALVLRTMGQRALIAVDNLFTLVTVCLAFYLWHSIPEPNTLQVVALALFGIFVLAANLIVRGGWRR